MDDSFSFVVDVGVGTTIENWLVSEGYGVIGIGGLNPEMTDVEILELAVRKDAVIITMDKDFGELIYKENRIHKGVLLLRLDDAKADEKLAVIQNIFPLYIEKIRHNFSVFQNGLLRIRTLF